MVALSLWGGFGAASWVTGRRFGGGVERWRHPGFYVAVVGWLVLAGRWERWGLRRMGLLIKVAWLLFHRAFPFCFAPLERRVGDSFVVS
jgi:hypothetical protein